MELVKISSCYSDYLLCGQFPSLYRNILISCHPLGPVFVPLVFCSERSYLFQCLVEYSWCFPPAVAVFVVSDYDFGYISIHFMQGGRHGSNFVLLQVGTQFCLHHVLSGLSLFFHCIVLLFSSKFSRSNFLSLFLGPLFYTTCLSVSIAVPSYFYLMWIFTVLQNDFYP